MAPLVRRTWGLRGHTPILHQRTRSHKKVSVIAALCVPPTRDRVHLFFRFHLNANINTDAVVVFLRALRAHLSGHAILVWDRLAAHRTVRVRDFLWANQVHGVFLPAYAPELNPVENLWSYLKMNPLANFAPADVDMLADFARRQGRSVQRKQDLLCSFIRNTPLLLRLT